MPKSYLREEEKVGLDDNAVLLAEAAEAARAGDHETEWEWMRLAEFPAHALMAAKRRNGAEWIRKMGLRTETAERVYGKDWLDK